MKIPMKSVKVIDWAKIKSGTKFSATISSDEIEVEGKIQKERSGKIRLLNDEKGKSEATTMRGYSNAYGIGYGIDLKDWMVKDLKIGK